MGESASILYPGDYAALLLLSADPARVVPPPPGTLPSPGGGGNACGCCPTGWFTDADDSIRFSVEVKGGPKTVVFGGRSRLKDGTIVRFGETITNDSATVPTEKFLPAGEGCVLGVGASVVGGIGAAIVCVVVELGVQDAGVFTPYATIYQGIITGCGTTGPSYVIGGGGNTVGFKEIIHYSAAGPAEPLTITVPVVAGSNVRIVSVSFITETSALVAFRANLLLVSVAGVTSWLSQDPTNLAANELITYWYSCPSEVRQTIDPDGSVSRYFVGPCEISYNVDFDVTANLISGIAGDNITQMDLFVEVTK